MGVLDGVTMFRFAHMARLVTRGGVESYLWNLNRALLHRNRIRIVQMYLSSCEVQGLAVEQLGRGELIWVPSVLRPNSSKGSGIAQRIKTVLHRRPRVSATPDHELFFRALGSYRPQLVVFHWISEDSAPLVDEISQRGIPFVVVNHFANSRLERTMIRKQVRKATAVAGVSDIAVPRFLASRFTNLSDAVDTEFFDPGEARHAILTPGRFTILLPARVCKEKGHLDAVAALSALSQAGVDAVLVFAGQPATEEFERVLIGAIEQQRVQERVLFAGELSVEELRNQYAVSDVVILPTYSEGLGRVLLEAQAMEKPVLAYDTGGVRAALVDKDTGFLVNKGDVPTLANHLKRLLADEDVRRRMGTRARAFVVERFSVVSLAERHERFYAQATVASAGEPFIQAV